MKTDNNKKFDIKERTFEFAVEILRLVSKLPKNTAGFELGKQILRSGTSIGANIEEAAGSRTKKEFINIVNISKKEARETYYWLRLLSAVKIVNPIEIVPLLKETNELISILTTIVKNSEKTCNYNS